MTKHEPVAVKLREPELPSFDRLPYPVALTARRMAEEVRSGSDPLKALFALKDCFEATIKYLGIILLMEYFSSRACTLEHSEALLERMVRPSLGDWVGTVVRDISEWLIATGENLGWRVAGFFMRAPQGRSAKPQATDLWKWCSQFVEYRNDALGHGATRRDAVYRGDMERWLPLLQQLLHAVGSLQTWRLLLVSDRDRCQVWMGPEPATATEPGEFRQEQIGHFVLRDRAAENRLAGGLDIRDLYPFICYVPDAQQQHRLHYYDSIYRYQETRRNVRVLEYDEGSRQVTPEPVAGLEARFTRELLAKTFGRHRSRMEVIEGRVTNFGELLAAHAEIVGRRFAIEHVKRFIEEHDRGLLLIEAEPGKGKTALLCHLIENEFGHYSPTPVHFFYRRTAGITDPDVCVKSLYTSLLETHGIEESEESRRQDSPEAVYHKLVNILSKSISPCLTPSRPQLIFIDALDEADATFSGTTAYQRIPENLPAGVYVIATTRQVRDRTLLARRSHLEFYDLDAPDLMQENLRDGAEFVARELAASELPSETIGEIARVGRGNFLVLKHLCGHVRSRLNPDEVGAFLSRLATAAAADQLGFIYEEFWSRMTERATLDERQCLGDVAGLLVAARTAVPAELICQALDLRAGAWDLALRRLIEYLTVKSYAEEQASETVYRIYHESFADYLRFKLATDRDRYERLLAEYCLRWAELPAGYARRYVLRFGPAHLMAAGKWDAVETLLTNLDFLEAKTEAGMVFELAGDFAAAVHRLPSDCPRRHILKLLEEALRRDIHFIDRHANDYPQGLFQCLWNTCWWYEGEEAAAHYAKPYPPRLQTQKRLLGTVSNTNSAPSIKPAGEKLRHLLESWRDLKLQSTPEMTWLRANSPPSIPLGTALQAILRGHEGAVNSIAFSPNGRRIVSGSDDETISLWDAESGAELAVLDGHEGFVNCVMYSPDGRRIASGSGDGTIRLWDAENHAELALWNVRGGNVTSLAFSSDGRLICSACNDNDTLGNANGLVQVWDAESGIEVVAWCAARQGLNVNSVAFSPDGRWIATGSDDGMVRVWSGKSGIKWTAMNTHYSYVLCVAYNPDGRRIVCGCHNGAILLWDTETGTRLDEFGGSHGGVSCVAFSPDGRRIASGSEDGTISVYDAESRAELAVLDRHEGPVYCVMYSPDGRRIASGSEDGTIRVWNTEARAERAVPLEHEGLVCSVAFSPDGRRIAVARDRDHGVRVCDTESGVEVVALGARGDDIRSVVYSPNGKQIVGGSDAGRVYIWDAVTGTHPAVLSGHELTVISVAYSPDGMHIASVSVDKTIRVWNVESHAEIAVLHGHESSVLSASFRPDGRKIVSNSIDGTIRVWDAQNGNCLEIIESSGDVKATATDVSRFPLRAISRLHETVIEQTKDGKPIAWFPIALAHIATHPSGRLWIGAVANHLYSISIEGTMRTS